MLIGYVYLEHVRQVVYYSMEAAIFRIESKARAGMEIDSHLLPYKLKNSMRTRKNNGKEIIYKHWKLAFGFWFIIITGRIYHIKWISWWFTRTQKHRRNERTKKSEPSFSRTEQFMNLYEMKIFPHHPLTRAFARPPKLLACLLM